MQGFSRIFLNEAREAREDAAGASREAALIGQPRAQMVCETLGVFASYETDDVPRMRLHLEREMALIRQMGARRFEAQNMEMRGRMLFDGGQRNEAMRVLREALALCRQVGMHFSGPKALSALSRAVEDDGERMRLLAEGEALLKQGVVGDNHFWFYADGIEAMLAMKDAERALHYADALTTFTRSEPLPWSELFAARGRALAAVLRRQADDNVRRDLYRVRETLMGAELKRHVFAVDAALAEL